MNEYTRIAAYVSIDAIRKNLDNLYQNVPENTSVIAVVKANAYGHGAVTVAHAIENRDYVSGFAVATIAEAVELRKSGIVKQILILGHTFKEEYEELIRWNITPTIWCPEDAACLSDIALAFEKEIGIHLALDTGMSRIGFSDSPESLEAIAKIAELPCLKIQGIFTHFAKADESDKTAALQQLRRFSEFTTLLKQREVPIAVKHCSNSAGIIELKPAHMDAVRAGISLYGIYPSDQVSRTAVSLYPALQLKSRIIAIRSITAGTSVGYGGSYTAESTRRIATVSAGYGDGYPRSLSNIGHVLIHGQKAPITGRVCMDQCMVDITDIPQAECLDEVVLLGKSGELEITLEELSELSKRYTYEFLCDINARVPRIYDHTVA
ncbi:MAG: alanine racemase [Lachnospiraceae bacterium]